MVAGLDTAVLASATGTSSAEVLPLDPVQPIVVEYYQNVDRTTPSSLLVAAEQATRTGGAGAQLDDKCGGANMALIRKVLAAALAVVVLNVLLMVVLVGGPSTFYECLEPLWQPSLFPMENRSYFTTLQDL